MNRNRPQRKENLLPSLWRMESEVKPSISLRVTVLQSWSEARVRASIQPPHLEVCQKRGGPGDSGGQMGVASVVTEHRVPSPNRGPGHGARDPPRDYQGHPCSGTGGGSPILIPGEPSACRRIDEASNHVYGGSGPPRAGGAATLRIVHKDHGECVATA